MSIKAMIAQHPDVVGHPNEALGQAVRHAMYCAAITSACADACAAEADAGERGPCIRLCNDASDVCTATYRVAARRTGSNEGVIRSILDLCASACDACAAMCERHDDDHCRRCAEMCRETARDCRAAAATI